MAALQQAQSARAPMCHPLDPLTAPEIESAIAILRSQRSLGEKVRFESIVLNEPPKARERRLLVDRVGIRQHVTSHGDCAGVACFR